MLDYPCLKTQRGHEMTVKELMDKLERLIDENPNIESLEIYADPYWDGPWELTDVVLDVDSDENLQYIEEYNMPEQWVSII